MDTLVSTTSTNASFAARAMAGPCVRVGLARVTGCYWLGCYGCSVLVGGRSKGQPACVR